MKVAGVPDPGGFRVPCQWRSQPVIPAQPGQPRAATKLGLLSQGKMCPGRVPEADCAKEMGRSSRTAKDSKSSSADEVFLGLEAQHGFQLLLFSAALTPLTQCFPQTIITGLTPSQLTPSCSPLITEGESRNPRSSGPFPRPVPTSDPLSNKSTSSQLSFFPGHQRYTRTRWGPDCLVPRISGRVGSCSHQFFSRSSFDS